MKVYAHKFEKGVVTEVFAELCTGPSVPPEDALVMKKSHDKPVCYDRKCRSLYPERRSRISVRV